MHLTSGQTWQFLTKIGVGGVDDSDMMVRRLEAMEARDVNRYEQAVVENIAKVAEADNDSRDTNADNAISASSIWRLEFKAGYLHYTISLSKGQEDTSTVAAYQT
ncbi:hypothetical protein Ancab_034273 [Ancistrocladus abbreviatus]